MDVVQSIQKIKDFPLDLHWFCPRHGDHDRDLYLTEDLQNDPSTAHDDNVERSARAKEFESRKALPFTCLKIFAFEGDDARPYQQYIEERLADQLSQCEICSREYHRGRVHLKEDLEAVHEPDEVESFLERLDQVNLDRIRNGLSRATQILKNVPTKERSIRILEPVALYAIFEALNCEPALSNESFLSNHFDEPFALIQVNKRLRISSYAPAVTHFLFHTNQARRDWAKFMWTKLPRNITATEFGWTVKTPLSDAMRRVQLSLLDRDFLPLFWNGLRHICGKMDGDLISRCLHTELGGYNVCKTALDHLQIDSDSFPDLLVTVDRILRISPNAFWEALASSSPVIWIDQFKNSPALFRQLVSVKADKPETQKALLNDLFRWTTPFVSTQRPTNQAASCLALLEMLFDDLQRDKYNSTVRTSCYMAGLKALTAALTCLNTDQMTSVQRTAIGDVLDLVNRHASKLISLSTKPGSQLAGPSADVVRQAIALECHCLLCDHDLLADRGKLQQDNCSPHIEIWNEVSKQVRKENIPFISQVLSGSKCLVGLEKFAFKDKSTQTSEKEQFNQTLDAINGYVADVIQRASEFDAKDAEELLRGADRANSCLAQLLSSDDSVRAATIELLKTASGTTVRREALQHFMQSGRYAELLNAYSLSLKRLAYMRTFAPAPPMLAICKDIVHILCDSSEGILRQGTIQDAALRATENFWEAIWVELQTIFINTEAWSIMGHQKKTMMDFCGDVMEFAGLLFDQSPLFASAIDADSNYTPHKITGAGKRLTEDPKTTLPTVLKFLRLRDEFLLRKSTDLVCDMLKRLKQFETAVDPSALTVLENMLSGETRTVLSITQKAELLRALETHLGKAVQVENEMKAQHSKPPRAKSSLKSGTIDLEQWKAKVDAEPRQANLQTTLSNASKATDAFRARQLASRPTPKPVEVATPKPSAESVAEFGRKRRAEIEAKKKRDAEAAAKARRGFISNGVDALTSGQGSGISGLGVSGKDHSIPKGEGMMVSSDESVSEESETEFDRELFGASSKPKKSAEEVRRLNEDRARRRALAQQPQGPVKKQRLVRSVKDMRARLAPDLAPLHKILLAWDFNHEGPFPPEARANDYATVLSKFRDPIDYQNTFQPLLTLEAWNGLLKAKDENTTRSFEVKVTNQTSVDAFIEVGASVDLNAAKNIGDGDLVVLSKDAIVANATSPVHCLSRIQRLTRKKTHAELLLRVTKNTQIVGSLKPNAVVYGLKTMSLVPLEREYGALLGLQYYDLCDEIAKARPSPLLKYSDERLQPYMKNYSLNKAQAKAVRSAIDNDAFTLVQGPPGSGKTKTITAIVGALLTDVLRNPAVSKPAPRTEFINANHPPQKKMLVCAPSNAAVDELVMRFKDGIKITTGETREVGIVRLGRSDAMNANVKNVTLDYLVEKKLNISSEASTREATQKLMMRHKDISEQLRQARAALDEKNSADNQRAVQELVRSKQTFGRQIDQAKDEEANQIQRADFNRRKAQHEVIQEAQVICATLSGSGHDMFQSLNVEFETVVIDEAAQCVELSALIPLKYGCAKCILVGDPQQLPPTVFSREAAHFKYEQSLFVRMQGNAPEHIHLLDTQYRMHPMISSFPSQTFYDGRLLDGPGMAKLRTRAWHAAELLGPYQFFDVQGQHQSAPRGHSLVNYAEIKIAIQLYRRLTTDFEQDFRGKVGVITPYKSQLSEMRDRFRAEFGDHITTDIDFNTTDAFQGRESEIIIFSCVRASSSGGIGFLQDIRRMNVGLTRAKSSLWVLGNSQSLIRGEYWRKLVEHSKSAGHFFSGDVVGTLSRPMKLTRKLDHGSHPDGNTIKSASVPHTAHSDEMEVDRHRPPRPVPIPSGAEVPGPESEGSATLQPRTYPVAAPSRTGSAIPAKRELSDQRPSSSSSAISGMSEATSASQASAGDVDMTDAPPMRKSEAADGAYGQTSHVGKKARIDPDSTGSGPPRNTKDRTASKVAASQNVGPPIVRRKKGTSIFAKDPTKRKA